VIDHRVHSRLIGAKGKAIAKVMDQFQVDVRFPKDKTCDIVTIQGLEENVEDAKYHLLTLAEDYVSFLQNFSYRGSCNCWWTCNIVILLHVGLGSRGRVFTASQRGSIYF